MPIETSIAFYNGIFLLIPGFDVPGQHIQKVGIGADIADGETLCGWAQVILDDGEVLDRRMVGKRGANPTTAGNPIDTLCN